MFAFLFIGWALTILWFCWHFINHFGYEINKWLEMNLGWFFVNGRKQAAWAEYLRKKYGNEKY